MNNEENLVKIPLPLMIDHKGTHKGELIFSLNEDWTYNNQSFVKGSLIHFDVQDFLNGNFNPQILFQPTETTFFKELITTDNYIFLNLMENVSSSIKRLEQTEKGWIETKVKTPLFGSIDFNIVDTKNDSFTFTYDSFLKNTSLLSHSAKTGELKVIRQMKNMFDPEKYVVNQKFVSSKDGVMIPYFIIHKKGMKLDGTNPTLLEGYGGFNISMEPNYLRYTEKFWLNNDGVYVLANIRGGGEFGPKWHQAAMLENKQKSYDDFIAIAEDLISSKVTSPKHLGIEGGSNGGLLVGATVTQRPELFNAALIEVPLLDMMRYHKLLAGASWIGEYGNPDEKKWADIISKYSPYQNLKREVQYPEIFFTTSTRDDRVHPAHARRMAKKMENYGQKFLFFENTEGGHGLASTNKQWANYFALMFSYLTRKLIDLK